MLSHALPGRTHLHSTVVPQSRSPPHAPTHHTAAIKLSPPASRHLCRSASKGGGPSSPQDEGSAEVQNALADILQIEVQRIKAKEELLEEIQERKQGLRKIGDELIEELARERELDNMRMDLASSSALADTLAQFSEVEEELQKVKRQLQADREELFEWEQEQAKKRNQGMFFKNLYQPPPSAKQPAAGGSASPPSETVRRIASSIKAPAEAELRSPQRLYIFSYLAVIVGVVVVGDLATGDASLPLDGFLALLGTLLGVNAWSERQAFQQQEAADAAASPASMASAAAPVAPLGQPARDPNASSSGSSSEQSSSSTGASTSRQPDKSDSSTSTQQREAVRSAQQQPPLEGSSPTVSFEQQFERRFEQQREADALFKQRMAEAVAEQESLKAWSEEQRKPDDDEAGGAST